jgi:ribosomal protein L35
MTTPPSPLEQAAESAESERGWMFYAVMGIGGTMLICLVLFALAVIAGLASKSSETVVQVVSITRDLLLMLMVLQGMLLGLALLIVVFQVARFLNVLQTEIDPVVETAQDTLQTLQGTAEFVSKHVTEPIIKTQRSVAQARRFTQEASGINELLAFYRHALNEKSAQNGQPPRSGAESDETSVEEDEA